MNWIEHIVEPTKLFLTWQSPDVNNRLRRVVAHLLKDGENNASLVYLTDTEDFKKAKEAGFTGFPAFGLERNKHDNALDIFLKRLPPKSRGDYDKYLEAIRIKPKTTISDFTLLGYSGVKLPDDDFVLLHPFDNAKGEFELLVEVCGFRHIDNVSDIRALLKEGQVVSLQKDTKNPVDSTAIKIIFNGIKLGYINRALLPVFNKWFDNNSIKKTVIERINGTATTPKLYLFVRMKV
ncbi:hypothetical protein RDn1_082 [Candidatus Termititenax dinenymphae]|uniref:HIRAN domain-containing protein n=1 Tax=Candidatus Termititenax dinenymphae TaxID=2218523 RepID=A0A388TJE8_9BACT|nr:hypothetical protein RDn1_082 [Candidatus Termititenax dinenymphae]